MSSGYTVDSWPEEVEVYFDRYSMVDRWQLLDSVYKTLELDLPDVYTRIDEYKWITATMNSFVSKTYNSLTSQLPDLDKVRDRLESIGVDQRLEIEERKQLVYMWMRNDWLGNLKAAVYGFIEGLEKPDGYDDEEDPDGWFGIGYGL